MKVLVIGSNGQVGCELTSTLTKLFHGAGRHHSVIFLGRSHLDLGNLPKISKILCEVAPDVIVNAAAYTAVDLAESNIDMAFTINARAVGEMAKYCHVSRYTLSLHDALPIIGRASCRERVYCIKGYFCCKPSLCI